MYSDDTQAISAVLKGDRHSYQSLIDRHKKMVYGIAWSHLGDSDLSEDAAQETFIKAYTYLGTLREPDKFAGWLARIARNVCNSFRRSARREKAFKERWAVLERAEAEPRIEGESLSEPLWSSFADLSPVHREALTAFYIEGKSVAEAAIALGISEQALRTRLHRARIVLREQLEHKLEESLGELRPSTNFTRSVLMLLPLSPKGIVGAGAAGIVGKLFASLSFPIWTAAVSTLPVWGLFSLFSRTDESSLSDAPEYRPVRAMIRRGYRKLVIGMFAGFALYWLLIQHVGSTNILPWIGALWGAGAIVAIWGALMRRRVGANTLGSIGNVAIWGMVSVVMVAISFFHASIVLFPVAILAGGILNLFVTPRAPQALQQIGANPFIRRLHGLAETPKADLTLDHTLSRLELRAFVRLLGSLGLARDYQLRGNAMTIILTGLKPHRLAGLGLVAGDSSITISPDGACTARISDSDLKLARETLGARVTAEELQDEACKATEYALSCFARGDAEAARAAFSTTTQGPARAQSPSSTRNHYVKMFVTVWIGVVCVVEFAVRDAVPMIFTAVVGFAVAMLILAVNLYITRRQSRSV